ncbi:hypothetical protein G6F32_014251 [Rhizopus arrhizus]|nr:hypothetical protein G6F32_014251 [Rhizopus arrhizus]
MVTSAPATGWPAADITWPPTPAEVLWAKAGAAASAATRPRINTLRHQCDGCATNGTRSQRNRDGFFTPSFPGTHSPGNDPLASRIRPRQAWPARDNRVTAAAAAASGPCAAGSWSTE